MNNLLDIQHLSVDFTTEGRKFAAVKDLSLTLQAGETLAIVGESGSGKSVTSLALLQLLNKRTAKVKGHAFYYSAQGEKDLVNLKEEEIRKIRGKDLAMIFQEPMTSLNPVITCGEQVAEAIRLHLKLGRKEAMERALALFEKVKLPRAKQIYHAYPHQVSGGQKQRVMISMAISCNPRILIADEPTTALDVTVQKTILELLGELQQEYKMGMIFITHDLGVVANLAHRVAVMYKGEVVETGEVGQIFSHPAHPYTKGLMACRPSVEHRRKKLPVIADFMQEDAKGLVIPLEKKSQEEDDIETDAERKAKHEKIYASEPVMRISHLKKYFPVSTGLLGLKKEYVKAVDDVSFDVYPGETLGLVGESGCGKSTLGKLILQLLPATSGEIIYKGTRIDQLSGKELRKMRKKVQVVFQDPYSSLNPRMRIGEAIAEPMRVHGLYTSARECRNAAITLLEKVGLEEKHYHRYPHEFSGGQRQRIVIARALGLQPEFLVCDEPVSALDVSVQAQVLNLLNQLKKENNLTYIFISHDLGVVKYFSDRIAVMNKGKIEQLGDADEVYHHPQTAYARELISAIPSL